MKICISLTFAALMVSHAFAEMSQWTRTDGKTAQLELIEATGTGDELTGKFKNADGQEFSIKASTLVAADAKRLAEWKPPTPSAFDEVLTGNLKILKGRSLKKIDDWQKPGKFYVFYYTASWCGPCHEFTPKLVEFYKANKNANFEIILITSDKGEQSMESYAAEFDMPWPQLEYREVEKFKKEFNFGVKGIPSVIVCDPSGKSLGNFRSKLPELAEMVK